MLSAKKYPVEAICDSFVSHTRGSVGRIWAFAVNGRANYAVNGWGNYAVGRYFHMTASHVAESWPVADANTVEDLGKVQR